MNSYCFSDEDHSQNLNTVLIITGFESSEEGVYYTALTSFGKDYADQGFIKIKAFDNTCGIAMMAIGMEMKYNTLY